MCPLMCSQMKEYNPGERVRAAHVQIPYWTFWKGTERAKLKGTEQD